MPDHAAWRIRPLGGAALDLALADAFALASNGHGRGEADPALSVAGCRFVERLRCGACGSARRGLWLRRGSRAPSRRCRACGEPLQATGFDTLAAVRHGTLPRAALRRPLRSLGLRSHDVFSLRGPSGRTLHFEIGAGTPASPAKPGGGQDDGR